LNLRLRILVLGMVPILFQDPYAIIIIIIVARSINSPLRFLVPTDRRPITVARN